MSILSRRIITSLQSDAPWTLPEVMALYAQPGLNGETHWTESNKQWMKKEEEKRFIDDECLWLVGELARYWRERGFHDNNWHWSVIRFGMGYLVDLICDDGRYVREWISMDTISKYRRGRLRIGIIEYIDEVAWKMMCMTREWNHWTFPEE